MLQKQLASVEPHLDHSYNNYINLRELSYLLIIWLVSGIALNALAIPVLFIFSVYLLNRGKYLYVFLAFFFTLILSDSRQNALSFAQDLKSVLVLLLFILLLFAKRVNLQLDLSKSLHRPFLLYLLFSVFCIVFSPVPFMAFQKTLSYGMLFLIVPIMFYSLYVNYGASFLKALVLLGVWVLLAGFVMYLVSPSLVQYNNGWRSSGALGNPNGLGLFSFLFFMLFYVVNKYFPQLFSKRQKFLIYFLILASLLWSGSRGQLVSLLIFIGSYYLMRRSAILGSVVIVSFCLIIFFIELDIIAIARSLGMESFLRVETLEEEGGRAIARRFAWEHIQDNFWIGKGFSYSEYLFQQNFYKLSMLGHEGGTHNTYLTVWLDSGLIGLLLFLAAWFILFYRASKNSVLAIPIAFAVVVSNYVEAWLTASLNPFTIQLVMILTILIYIVKNEEPTEPVIETKVI